MHHLTPQNELNEKISPSKHTSLSFDKNLFMLSLSEFLSSLRNEVCTNFLVCIRIYVWIRVHQKRYHIMVLFYAWKNYFSFLLTLIRLSLFFHWLILPNTRSNNLWWTIKTMLSVSIVIKSSLIIFCIYFLFYENFKATSHHKHLSKRTCSLLILIIDFVRHEMLYI